MKKYFLIMVMAFTMSINSFADSSNVTKVTNVEKFEMKVNKSKLGQTLGLSKDQMEMAEDVINEFERNMMFAAYMDSESSSNKIVSNAVKKNIQHMHYILNSKQYRKYLMLLNLTLENRGFDLNEIGK